jgi:hemolysin activation/secretion protein
MAFLPNRGRGLVVLLLAAGVDAAAQSHADTQAQQAILQQQREQAAQNQQLGNEPDVRLPRFAIHKSEFPQKESPCFPIREIQLDGDGAEAFQ